MVCIILNAETLLRQECGVQQPSGDDNTKEVESKIRKRSTGRRRRPSTLTWQGNHDVPKEAITERPSIITNVNESHFVTRSQGKNLNCFYKLHLYVNFINTLVAYINYHGII